MYREEEDRILLTVNCNTFRRVQNLAWPGLYEIHV